LILCKVNEVVYNFYFILFFESLFGGAENAEPENAGPENVGPNVRG